MTQEEKNLLLKDLCARLPYKLKVKVPTLQEDAVFTLVAICEDYITVIKDNGSYFDVYTSIDCFPLLRPMSSMTDEEAMEIAILHDIKDIISVKVTSDYIDVIVDDGVCSTERRTILYDEIVSSIKCFDWLNAHYFDYRGLLERGLAIAVTENNNPYKK